eukprot:12268763-Heterocapsa_arctica.AAC.1
MRRHHTGIEESAATKAGNFDTSDGDAIEANKATNDAEKGWDWTKIYKHAHEVNKEQKYAVKG